MSNYDESKSRKLMRMAFWSYLWEEGTRQGPFVGLAGDYAGDLATLTALGVDPDEVVLFDTAIRAIKNSRLLYPEHTKISATPVEVGISHLKRVRGVFLDFADTIDDTLLKVIKKVGKSAALDKSCMLGIGVTVGGESKANQALFVGPQALVDKHFTWARDDVHALYSLPSAPYLSRALLLIQVMNSIKTVGGSWRLQRMWTHESRETGKGQHSLIVVFRKEPGKPSPVAQLMKGLWHPNFRLPGKEAASRYLGKMTNILENAGLDSCDMLGTTTGSRGAYLRLGRTGWYD